jgi:hypothetical protein
MRVFFKQHDVCRFLTLHSVSPLLYHCDIYFYEQLNTQHLKWVTADVVAVYPVSMHCRTNCICCQ